jgi:hypothetical protein
MNMVQYHIRMQYKYITTTNHVAGIEALFVFPILHSSDSCDITTLSRLYESSCFASQTEARRQETLGRKLVYQEQRLR